MTTLEQLKRWKVGVLEVTEISTVGFTWRQEVPKSDSGLCAVLDQGVKEVGVSEG